MYFIKLLRRLRKKSNWFIVIYLSINMAIIISALMEEGFSFLGALGCGTILYGIGIVAAYSGVGDRILRRGMGCRMVKKEEKDFIMPLFLEVYAKARIKETTISENVRIFVKPGRSPNAYAAGKRTICITEGVFKLPAGQVKAMLAHEFGHIAHKDTDIMLLIYTENILVSGAFVLWIILLNNFYGAILVFAMARIWSDVGAAILRKANRINEFLADDFVYELGYGRELYRRLVSIFDKKNDREYKYRGHPCCSDRAEKLQILLDSS